MSDRMDRRYVLAILSGVAFIAGFQIFVIQPGNVTTLLILIGVFGATANALYPIAVAHANDFAKSSDFVAISGGLLLLYGIGTVIGPTVGGPVMQYLGPYSLFAVTAVAHLLIVIYAIVRSRMRAPVPVGERDSYQSVSSGTTVTRRALRSIRVRNPCRNRERALVSSRQTDDGSRMSLIDDDRPGRNQATRSAPTYPCCPSTN